ncbi:sigma-70 family RNA polymerase sigma factor [Puniceibacterium sp. IMCC21224]|uniref:sigma-70 family RNA polymerase sigma factor n=1 Tax=Puniceibacterium sp. IMCC21224 TaxID=1618204 RepID=UPI00064DBB53|nr:sigma-70 family RNA polymerase sigma factor [Puniceibacterium sp. IMCC21224]KMK67871.1 RNA polymerase sigma factor, sigma-70 family [Puniceibacterium sp. IMCC21224]
MTTTTPQEEIEDMLARIAMGDRKAFSALYQRTSAKLFGICLRVLADRAEAEEALQEVFLRIWNKAGMYRANGYSPMTWLITIARNISVDRRRRRPAAASDGLDVAEILADPGPGPEAQTIARDDGDRLQMCLSELPPDRAMMVQRAYLDGDTYADLADLTGVKLNTVRTWLRRSLLQLRECLSR